MVPPFLAVPYPSFPYIHPSQGVSQYGAIHQSDQGSSSWQKSSLPGNPGSASSCPHRQGGLQASSSRSLREESAGEEDWEYLVEPNFSIEKRKSLEAKSEDNTSDNEGDFQEEGAELSKDLLELLTMALKQPIKPQMRRIQLERYPRLRHSPSKP